MGWVFLRDIRNRDFIFGMVTISEFFQHTVIEFPVEKLGISHRFISQENTHWKEHNRCHPHATKRLHHIFFNKFSSEIIQEKKDDEKYNGEDQGKTDSITGSAGRVLHSPAAPSRRASSSWPAVWS